MNVVNATVAKPVAAGVATSRHAAPSSERGFEDAVSVDLTDAALRTPPIASVIPDGVELEPPAQAIERLSIAEKAFEDWLFGPNLEHSLLGGGNRAPSGEVFAELVAAELAVRS